MQSAPTEAHRTGLALLLSASVCALHSQAQAQTPQLSPFSPTVQVYGTIDLAVGQIETQSPGSPTTPITTVRGVHSGGMQTSYVGFRGSEDLGDGLRANFAFESFLRADTGQTGRFDASPASGADMFWSRESYVGLGGRWGDLRLGNNAHPTWISMIQTSAMGSNSVFSPGFRQLFNGSTRGRSELDTSMVNSIKYQAPMGPGWSGSVAVQAREGSGTAANYSANLSYRDGPLFLTLAHTQVRHAATPNLPGAREQDMSLLGGSYELGAIKLFGQFTNIRNTRLATKSRVPHLGLSAALGSGRVQLAWAQDKNTASTTTTMRRTTSAGYVYPFSKRTELYAFVMQDKVAVGNANSYVSGLRHQF